MTLVSELELPAFDYTDPSLRGDSYHAAMAELRATALRLLNRTRELFY